MFIQQSENTLYYKKKPWLAPSDDTDSVFFLKEVLLFKNNKLLLNITLCSFDSGRKTMLRCCQGFQWEPQEHERRKLSEAGLSLSSTWQHVFYGVLLHWWYTASSTCNKTSIYPQSSNRPFMSLQVFSGWWMCDFHNLLWAYVAATYDL